MARHNFTDEEVQSLRSKGRILSSEEYRSFPRLIQRNLPFNQSISTVSVRNKEKGTIPIFPMANLRYILKHNFFHVMLRWPSLLSLFLLLLFWVLWLLIFAQLYVFLDAKEPNLSCGLGKPGKPISFAPALSFSLETCTTVGYSLPNNTNNFFEAECFHVQFAIYLQMTSSMIFNAFFTGELSLL